MINIFEGGRRATKIALWTILAFYLGLMFFGSKSESSYTLSLLAACMYGGVYLFGLSVGWIIRGVLGIPSGQDFPPQGQS